METKRGKFFTEFQSADGNGPFSLQIQNDCSQLRLEGWDCEVVIDVDVKELTIIRDLLTEVIDNKEKKTWKSTKCPEK